MVIHQFNKLIRNKWFWGAFAILISAAFCFDDLFTNRGDREERLPSGAAGTLAGEPVDARLYESIAEEIRGFGQQRDWKRDAAEVNREAWENYAALRVADRDGIEVMDAEIQAMIRNDRSFQQNGAFSFALYQQLLRANGLTPERFESYLKRRMTLMRLGQVALASAVWSSPMEIDRAVADMTDVLTVKVAKFTQDKAAAEAVKLDDAGLRKWYDDNTNSLALPERVKVRLVKFSATDPMVLAKMKVTEDEIRDRFDVTVDKYTTKDTNGVEKVRTFDELTKDEKSGIENELRQIAAIQYFETNLSTRAYGAKSVTGVSRLDEIAKEDNLKVVTSDWFALDGAYQEGFMTRASLVCPGAEGFVEAVAELDPACEDLRYAVVSAKDAVWLVEKAETSAKHVPTFEEAKETIRPRALRDAKADAFKAEVEAIAAKGAAAVLATKDVSTNITFSVADLRSGSAFENQMSVVRASMKLHKGEVSDFTLTAPGKAILVVCESRYAGDAAQAMVLRGQMRDEVAAIQLRQIPDAWKKWNLDRLGFEAGAISSVESVEAEE